MLEGCRWESVEFRPRKSGEAAESRVACEQLLCRWGVWLTEKEELAARWGGGNPRAEVVRKERAWRAWGVSNMVWRVCYRRPGGAVSIVAARF